MFGRKKPEVERKSAPKPWVTPIAVHDVPKQKVKTTYGGRYGNGETYTDSLIEQTVVLYVTFTGVLKTKTFEGKWTLEEVSKWTLEKED